METMSLTEFDYVVIVFDVVELLVSINLVVSDIFRFNWLTMNLTQEQHYNEAHSLTQLVDVSHVLLAAFS